MGTAERQAHTALARAEGRKIKAASSSLNTFAIELDDGSAILATAKREDDNVMIAISSVDAASLPKLADAVCSVDWSWICGSILKKAGSDDQQLKLELDPAGPLSVSVSVWQGSPFLAFRPFKAQS